VFHQWRSKSIVPFTGLCKGGVARENAGQGVDRAKLLALGAMVIYQLVLLYHHERHLPLG
jgi:hypothetical protein